MSDTANLLLIGLPGSGKTTYLAALWHVLDDQSSVTSLKRTGLSDDRGYLNRIVEQWRACTQVPRTTIQTEETVELHLDGDGFGSFKLVVPDLSGEAFEQQVEQRRMSVRYAELLQDTSGVILFVHPDVQKGTQIAHQNQLEVAIGGAAIPSNGADRGPVAAAPWSIERLPTQVKLVELLQFIMEHATRKVRVAVIVSAWDLIEDLGLAPHEYLSRETPLLRQFLDANDDLLECAVFGVSAQGGDIPDQKSALLELDALERIKVCYGNEMDHDITKPIAWLLSAK